MEYHSLGSATTDQLEQDFIKDERLIGQLRSRQAMRLTELDRRQVHSADGCRTMSEWVASRADVSTHTAKRLVSATRRMIDRPDVLAALAGGEVSFERAEQVCKTTSTVSDVAHLDIAGITRHVAKQNHLTRVEEQDAFAGRYLTMQPNLDQSMWKVWGQLAGLDGAIVQDALFAKADTFPQESRQDSRATRNADALVAMGQDSLTSTPPPPPPPTDHPSLVLSWSCLSMPGPGRLQTGMCQPARSLAPTPSTRFSAVAVGSTCTPTPKRAPP